MFQNSVNRKEADAADLKRIKLVSLAKDLAASELKALQKAKLIRRKNRPKDKAKPIKLTKCFLCGAMVEFMREHKHKVHGENLVLPSPAPKHSDNQWVTIYEGGLPGLGKKS